MGLVSKKPFVKALHLKLKGNASSNSHTLDKHCEVVWVLAQCNRPFLTTTENLTKLVLICFVLICGAEE